MCVFFCVLILASCGHNPTSAYVNFSEVFDNYDGKKELEKRYITEVNELMNLNDSLKFAKAQYAVGDPKFEFLTIELKEIDQKLAKKEMIEKVEMQKQILRQIDEFSILFCKENGIDFFFKLVEQLNLY